MNVFTRFECPNGTHGFVLWKGTDVRMDFTCECGNTAYIDGDYAYAVKCEACGVVWAMNPYIRLERLTPAEAAEFAKSTRIAPKENEEDHHRKGCCT